MTIDDVWGIFSRALGIVFFVHLLSVLTQLRRLVGRQGLEPAQLLFKAIRRDLRPLVRVLRFPSLFLLNDSDAALVAVCVLALVASAAIALGLSAGPAFLIVWVCWLSIQTSNPTLFSYPWDILMTECAFLGIFLRGNAPPPVIVAIAFNGLLFRVIFGMGITRFRKVGETERDLSYVFHFLLWQPMPTPLAYFARRLPMWVHRLSFVFLFFVELIAVFGIFGPPAVREVAAVSIVLLQLGIWATGNYGTFNLATLVLCLPLLLPLPSLSGLGPVSLAALGAYLVLTLPTVLIANFWTGTVWLYQRKLLRESRAGWLLRPLAAILRFLAPFRVLNSYGVFRHQEVYVRDRLIPRLQGSHDGVEWRDYETKYLSSGKAKAPRFFAPHHPRLDHFLFYGLCERTSFKIFMVMACNPYYFHPFCLTEKLVQKLLRNDERALSLFAANPFPDAPPRFIRYVIDRYAFTTPAEKAATGHWYTTERLGVSDPIGRREVGEMEGIRDTYDPYISESLTKLAFSERAFIDPRTGAPVPLHLHTVKRFI